MVFAAILARAWLKVLRRYLKGQEEEELRSRMHQASPILTPFPPPSPATPPLSRQGKLHLEDVEFRWQAFEHMSFAGASGFRLKHGRLGRLTMTLNRNQVFGETPFYVSVRGVRLVFEPQADHEVTAEWVQQHAAQWRRLLRQPLRAQKLFGSTGLVQYTGENTRSRIFMRLLQNTQLLLTDIQVSFDFPPTDSPTKGRPATPGFRFSLHVGSVAVTGGAATASREASDESDATGKKGDSVSLSKKVQASRVRCVWTQLPPAEGEEQAVLEPIGVEVGLALQLNHARRQIALRLHAFARGAVHLRLTHTLCRDAIAALDQVELYHRHVRYRLAVPSRRPSRGAGGSVGAWWRFALRSIRRDLEMPGGALVRCDPARRWKWSFEQEMYIWLLMQAAFSTALDPSSPHHVYAQPPVKMPSARAARMERWLSLLHRRLPLDAIKALHQLARKQLFASEPIAGSRQFSSDRSEGEGQRFAARRASLALPPRPADRVSVVRPAEEELGENERTADLLQKDGRSLHRFLLPMASLKQLSLQTDFTLSLHRVSIALGDSDPMFSFAAFPREERAETPSSAGSLRSNHRGVWFPSTLPRASNEWAALLVSESEGDPLLQRKESVAKEISVAETAWNARLSKYLPEAGPSTAHAAAHPPPLRMPEFLPSGRSLRKKIEPSISALLRLTPSAEAHSTKSSLDEPPRPRGELELRLHEICLSTSHLIDGEANLSVQLARLELIDHAVGAAILHSSPGRSFSISHQESAHRWAISASTAPLSLNLPHPEDLLDRLHRQLGVLPLTSDHAVTRGRHELRRAPRLPWDLVMLPCSITIALGGLEASVGHAPDDLHVRMLPSHLRVEQEDDGVVLLTDTVLLRCSNLRDVAARWAQLHPLVHYLLDVLRRPRAPPALPRDPYAQQSRAGLATWVRSTSVASVADGGGGAAASDDQRGEEQAEAAEALRRLLGRGEDEIEVEQATEMLMLYAQSAVHRQVIVSELHRAIGDAARLTLSAAAFRGLQDVLGTIMLCAMEDEDMSKLSSLVRFSQVLHEQSQRRSIDETCESAPAPADSSERRAEPRAGVQRGGSSGAAVAREVVAEAAEGTAGAGGAPATETMDDGLTDERPGDDGEAALLMGVLFKRGRINTSWRRRTAVLCRNGQLRYFKASRLRGVVDVGAAVIINDPVELKGSRPYSFSVRAADRIFYAAAENAAAQMTWIEALRSCSAASPGFKAEPAARQHQDDSDGSDDAIP
ncbi:hypothetical protein AB1Y20_009176 [Prymnesium parvum]|uniref:PH domain-containing protein n=1 Tax=Prymnesium parvum TaxID=97485 RepID=A0AB34JZY2_PRYPA